MRMHDDCIEVPVANRKSCHIPCSGATAQARVLQGSRRIPTSDIRLEKEGQPLQPLAKRLSYIND